MHCLIVSNSSSITNKIQHTDQPKRSQQFFLFVFFVLRCFWILSKIITPRSLGSIIRTHKQTKQYTNTLQHNVYTIIFEPDIEWGKILYEFSSFHHSFHFVSFHSIPCTFCYYFILLIIIICYLFFCVIARFKNHLA